MLNKGFIQVYTGNGKGKTTAAIGLVLRAAGAGLKSFIAQFVKGEASGEIKALERFKDMITVRQYGRGLIRGEPGQDDIDMARKGLKEAEIAMQSGEYEIIVLDEANIATHLNLFSVNELLEFIKSKPERVELVITGRNADVKIIKKADLVTEMKEIKHYKDRIKARLGIEW